MIPILQLNLESERRQVEDAAGRAAAGPAGSRRRAGPAGKDVAAVEKILADVARARRRGDRRVVAQVRRPEFHRRADPRHAGGDEGGGGAGRAGSDGGAAAVDRAGARVPDSTSCPRPPPTLQRPGVELGLRFTPLDSAGLYFPGGKAAYPSSLIMLAVPAQVAGVKRIVVCTPPSKYGRSDLVLAACHELGLTDVYPRRRGRGDRGDGVRHADDPRRRQDRRPGQHVRAARQARAGRARSAIDGFLGPSEILVLADETGRRRRSSPPT